MGKKKELTSEEFAKAMKGEKIKAEGIKVKIKTELGYMKKGVKVLPKVVLKKGKQWVKSQIQAAKESAKLEREIGAAAKAAERKAYKSAAIKQAKLRGIAKAKERKTGWRGQLQEVGEIGDRMSVGKMLGVETGKKPEKVVRRSEVEGLAGMSASDFLFSGLGKEKKKKK